MVGAPLCRVLRVGPSVALNFCMLSADPVSVLFRRYLFSGVLQSRALGSIRIDPAFGEGVTNPDRRAG